MRGFPPLQLLILAIAFGILAVPMIQLTSPIVTATTRTAVRGGPVETLKAGVRAVYRIRYAHRPVTLSLTRGSDELLKQPDLSQPTLEFNGTVLAPREGDELLLSATWPAGTPDTALTLEVEPDGLETHSQTKWSTDNQLNEVMTFQW